MKLKNSSHLNLFSDKKKRKNKTHKQGCHKKELIQMQKWTGPKV